MTSLGDVLAWWHRVGLWAIEGKKSIVKMTVFKMPMNYLLQSYDYNLRTSPAPLQVKFDFRTIWKLVRVLTGMCVFTDSMKNRLNFYLGILQIIYEYNIIWMVLFLRGRVTMPFRGIWYRVADAPRRSDSSTEAVGNRNVGFIDCEWAGGDEGG